MPTEVFFVNDTPLLSDPEHFVDLGLQSFWYRVNNDNWNKITTNLDSSLFAITEKTKEYTRYDNQKEPESKGIFKAYSTMNLFELRWLI